MKILAELKFESIKQHAQEYGTNNEYMISTVEFSIILPDKVIKDLSVDIKQTVGDSFEYGAIEVGQPRGLKAKLDYATFRDAVEKYYRMFVGSSAIGMKIENGRKVRMKNNTFIHPWKTEIDIDTEAGGW